MSSPGKINITVHSSKITQEADQNEKNTTQYESNYSKRIEELSSRPRRNPFIHWMAFVLSLVSMIFLVLWMAGPRILAPLSWVFIDVILSAFFLGEFFTRSGFRWDRFAYIRSRFFDFIAMIPVLALVGHGFVGENIWVWIILITRTVRSIDRVLGDGFIMRNVFALLEGFEEEITDRVLLRIIARIQTDLEHGNFGEGIALALAKNKSTVLQRIGREHPFEGIGNGLAHLVGLDSFIKRVEEHTFDSIVDILNSPEFDRMIRDSVDSVFTVMREEVKVKQWHHNLGIKPSNKT